MLDNIILVDDDSATNYLNEILIKRNKLANSVITFDNGMSVIEHLNASDNKNPFAIILDLNMPVMDGWEVIEYIENTEITDSEQCKVVILTASQNPDDLKKSENFSCVSSFLNKPLNVESLKEILKS